MRERAGDSEGGLQARPGRDVCVRIGCDKGQSESAGVRLNIMSMSAVAQNVSKEYEQSGETVHVERESVVCDDRAVSDVGVQGSTHIVFGDIEDAADLMRPTGRAGEPLCIPA